ncbi:uncharacterized protein LOC131315122 [Rhododendron vialii]|uniref:uncharacterized protein LOC131315122 n=1 Tax=Rhododendron vialii TaxID=182163 RepID=UPI00265F1DF0|nr:uncharacterized protein LOC131315122 [Rhododendron vialii]
MSCRRLSLVLLTNGRALCNLPDSLPVSQITFFAKSFSWKTLTTDAQSFTVSYLISSCGLSPGTALNASRKVKFRSAEQPDSVLTLLRNHGFIDSHIYKLSKSRPDLLLADPKNTLLPKLEFFQSIGIQTADLGNIFSSYPTLLKSSLRNQIIPVYNYLKSVIFLDDKQVRQILKAMPRFFSVNLGNKIVPKVSALRELGAPASKMSMLVTYHPGVLLQSCKKFDEAVKDVVEMGFHPTETKFVLVLKMMLGFSKSTLERKREVFRKYGWSENDLREAFRKEPVFMGLSEEKIMSSMDFLVNEMGWKPAAIAKVPRVLSCSVKTRTIPRCLVIKVLISKGLMKKDVSLATFLIGDDKYFLDKFVTKYEEDVPELLDVFSGKMSLAELGCESEEKCARKLS